MTWLNCGVRTCGKKPKCISEHPHCDKCGQLLENCVCAEIKRKQEALKNTDV